MVFSDLRNWLSRTLNRWSRYHDMVEELSGLPDCVLGDLGINRSDIRRTVWRLAASDHEPNRLDLRSRLLRPRAA
jgi:uncharacterized protein YjiS (DUF1127 family)